MLEVDARVLADAFQYCAERALVEILRRPAVDQIGEHGDVRAVGRQAALSVSGKNAQAVVDGAIKRCCIPQKFGFLALEVSHFFDHVDALGRVKHLIENTRALQTQIHQNEVDVVVAARRGLQRIAAALLALETRAHLGEIAA